MIRSRAGRMQLLARVETARESRCRSSWKQAEAAFETAEQQARAAATALDRTREECASLLRQDYGAALGLHVSRDIQTLRALEMRVAARQAAALAVQQTAEQAARAASAVLQQAHEAWQVVSQRSQRRTRLADTLRQGDALAAMVAEEEAVADELMDRVGAAVAA